MRSMLCTNDTPDANRSHVHQCVYHPTFLATPDGSPKPQVLNDEQAHADAKREMAKVDAYDTDFDIVRAYHSIIVPGVVHDDAVWHYLAHVGRCMWQAGVIVSTNYFDAVLQSDTVPDAARYVQYFQDWAGLRLVLIPFRTEVSWKLVIINYADGHVSCACTARASDTCIAKRVCMFLNANARREQGRWHAVAPHPIPATREADHGPAICLVAHLLVMYGHVTQPLTRRHYRHFRPQMAAGLVEKVAHEVHVVVCVSVYTHGT